MSAGIENLRTTMNASIQLNQLKNHQVGRSENPERRLSRDGAEEMSGDM
jgi:hypothetical protein